MHHCGLPLDAYALSANGRKIEPTKWLSLCVLESQGLLLGVPIPLLELCISREDTGATMT